VVSHGEGRADFGSGTQGNAQAMSAQQAHAVLRYVDAQGQAARSYPTNPNGSVQGWTGFTNTDGRITLMMPHPERVFRSVQLSWIPPEWRMAGDDSPWMLMFRNARQWVGRA